MNRVIHFEIHADDPERAAKFYKDIFGWEITKWDGGSEPYWMIKTGPDSEPGINGGLMKRIHPEGNVYNTIGVSSVDEFVKKIESKGGQNVVPKMAIPGVGYVAYCKDTEGNIFGIYENDPNAK